MNTKETFGTRLAKLRTDTDISAREMSLDLGQNPSYINRIENSTELTPIPLEYSGSANNGLVP